MSARTAVDAASVEAIDPAGTARGTVLILPGRGDSPSYYRRLAARLATDGYASRVASASPGAIDDVVELWRLVDHGAGVVVGVDAAAGLLAAALVEGRLDPPPAGVVFAGTAAAGIEAPDREDELSQRSACPVHRGVVGRASAPAIADATLEPSWPDTPARTPALALHGEADTVSPLDRVLPLYEGWDAEVVTVAGGLHDVLNDVHHRSVAAEIVSFLERLRADTAGTPILTRVRQR